jgi:hypothetical protein
MFFSSIWFVILIFSSNLPKTGLNLAPLDVVRSHEQACGRELREQIFQFAEVHEKGKGCPRGSLFLFDT